MPRTAGYTSIFLVLVLLFSSCAEQPGAALVNRWDFIALKTPGIERVLTELGNSGTDAEQMMRQFLLDDKLVLRSDSSFDLVLFKQYVHGKWNYDPDQQYLYLHDASAAKLDVIFHVDTVNANVLKIDLDEFGMTKLTSLHASDENGYRHLQGKAWCQFLLTANNDRYSDAAEDPYSIDNNWWRMKPFEREPEARIRERVLNHLRFWEIIFTDADAFDRDWVSYNWFASPLVIAVNGAQLLNYPEVKQQWDGYFFDSADAHKGFELMRKCFSKKIKYLKTDNKFRRSADMVQQLTNNLEQATAGK